MAACGLRGAPGLKLADSQLEKSRVGHARLVAASKMKCCRVEFSCLTRGIRMVSARANSAGFDWRPWRLANSLTVSCLSSEKENNTENLDSEEKLRTESQIVPVSFKVQPLLTTICDTTSIAEVELKLGDFQVYVKRDLPGKSVPAPTPSVPQVPSNTSSPAPNSNGSAASNSLAITKPETVSGSIQNIVENASNEGLVIVRSPKVGFFKISRTIKGKKAPPSCKEKEEVKEGKVVCYVDQLGGEVPVESDVSGEVVKILRNDGDPVGYGDALIAILPSFPGIKKLQ